MILTLTREMGVNLAGIEIILNMREKMARCSGRCKRSQQFVRHELARGLRSALRTRFTQRAGASKSAESDSRPEV